MLQPNAPIRLYEPSLLRHKGSLKLGTAQRKLYASREYFSNTLLPDDPDDLQEHPILLMGTPHASSKLTLFSDQKQQLSIGPGLVVDGFSVLQECAFDGAGIATLPEYMCLEHLDDRRLIEVLPDWHMKTVDIYALYSRYRTKMPKGSAFLDVVTALFEQR